VSRLPANSSPGARIWPDVSSVDEVRRASDCTGLVLSEADLTNLSATHVVPWFNSVSDLSTFEKMRARPRLAGGGGWITGRHDARWDFRSSGPHARLAHEQWHDGGWRVRITLHVVALG